MEDQSEQNKTEPPTPFKLSKARQKGTVARGLDLGFATSLVALLGYLWLFAPQLAGSVGLAARRTLVTAPALASGSDAILHLVASLLATVAQPLLFMVGVIFITVLIFEIVQTGFVFTFSPLTPNFGKLNPANGLKRIVSVRQLIETAKNVFKLAIYAAITAIVILEATKQPVFDVYRLTEVIQAKGLLLLILFAGAAVIIAAIDQLIARRDFFKRMRMSRYETRRESRDREGDPRFKQRRRQVHREYARLSKSLKNVRGADVLITNPTHYAVALKYDARTMSAPRVVAQGSDQLALRLRRLAFLHGVVTVENRELARHLYHRCQMEQQIPELYFRSVADVYRNLGSQKTRSA